ncbi:MAG TPA: hypothetical protein VJ969_03260 [Desulfopila sp.]|nr:hypothetical protein [Desulfopila sp.]
MGEKGIVRQALEKVGKSRENEDEAGYFQEVAESAGIPLPVTDVLKDEFGAAFADKGLLQRVVYPLADAYNQCSQPYFPQASEQTIAFTEEEGADQHEDASYQQ